MIVIPRQGNISKYHSEIKFFTVLIAHNGIKCHHTFPLSLRLLETGPHYTAEAGLDLLIFLSLSPSAGLTDVSQDTKLLSQLSS